MAPSSSGSWPGGGPGDIIDLDRYMRGNVRPSRKLSSETVERLVVDGGGCNRARTSSSRSSANGDAHKRHERASHDSGVSDGSYCRERRNHRSIHRNRRYQPRPNFYPPYEPAQCKTLSRRSPSSSSIRAFRTVCEQTLLDQQRQIARVTELCERLTERAVQSEKPEKSVNAVINKRAATPKRSKQLESEKQKKVSASDATSDLSSSSRSTQDPKQKGEKYQQRECKTYKIIMSKLDELSLLFAPRPPRAAHPRSHRVPSSSTSVSVCDKLVATDPQRTFNRVLAPSHQRYSGPSNRPAAPVSVTSAARSSRLASARAVTNAFAVDIAPRARTHMRTNVCTESIVKCELSRGSSHKSACDPRCGFDLEDPVHLYSQAKRLRSPTSSRRAHSVETAGGKQWLGTHARKHADPYARKHASAPSLCAVCRGYWRYLLQCLPPLARAMDSCKYS